MSGVADRAGAPAADSAARAAIRERLDDNLFVEAGAGSGKTSSLVDRVVALVTTDDATLRVPLGQIAAITFTEKAAAELRDRIRVELEATARRAAAGGATRERCRRALDELDGAAISTLHAFAQRLLSEHPIEARLPPRIEVLDEIGSGVAFDERFDAFFEALLDDPSLETTLLLAVTDGITRAHLRDLARQLGANWDLVAEGRTDGGLPPLPGLGRVEQLAARLDAVAARATTCAVADDLMVAHLATVAAEAAQLRGDGPPVDRLARVLSEARITTTRGRKENWPAETLAAIRAELAEIESDRQAIIEQIRGSVLGRLTDAVARFTLEAARHRQAEGRLEFHDLLVLARGLLRDPDHGPDVRRRLRDRYRRLLLDEFQDTDPIQIELALLLADPDPGASSRPWSELRAEPGRLFLVGDPKQSIYRFRRADIKVFLDARDSLGADVRRLTRNFRTTRPVVDWVNHVFGDLISAKQHAQPEYVPLDAARLDEPPGGPPVVLLGAEPHPDRLRADDLRRREAESVAAAVRTALSDGWSVAERLPGREDRWRPARLGDICILLPARTSLDALESALEDAGIPYRAETSSLVWSTAEIRDLLAVARAVDSPGDDLALLTALRSPGLGCGDDDLFDYAVTHDGRLSILARPPADLPDDQPVVEALAWLRALHHDRQWLSPSEVLDRIVRDRRLLEGGVAAGRPRDLWRRVRFVVDQARAFGEAEGGSLRDFLAWAARQSAEGARVVETVLPETDDDAVRIMTIHGAKGLEFPICILSGLTTAMQHRAAGVRVLFPGGGHRPEVSIRKGLTTDEFDLHTAVDEQMDREERIRLLYVAATRACDHLVVSLHRCVGAPGGQTNAAVLAEASSGAPHQQPLVAGLGHVGAPPPPEVTPLPPRLPPRDEWAASWAEAKAAAEVARTVSATRLAAAATRAIRSPGALDGDASMPPAAGLPLDESAATDSEGDPGLAKEPRDLELPPWQRGRYGTAIGRAVHAVLQTVDLATGDGLDDAAAAQSAAEGVLGFERRVGALARAALASPVVREAASAGCRREMYVAVPIGARLLEGYVDLVFRGHDGLVVVDYKTDAVDPDDLDAALARYRLQGAAYALAIEAATAERVARCVFLFLREDGAIARDIGDLPGAMAEVRQEVERTGPSPSPGRR